MTEFLDLLGLLTQGPPLPIDKGNFNSLKWANWGGRGEEPMKYALAKGPVCILVILGVLLMTGGKRPALGGQGETTLAIGATVIGVIGTSALAYGIWRNRPSQQGREQPRFFSGEFYVGGYVGGSLVQDTDLKFEAGIVPAGGNVTAFKQKFEPAVVGGLKFGYFCQQIPYLGLEAETNFARNYVRNQQVTLSRPVQGTTQAILPNDNWVAWTMALHIVGRYGFLPDKEVPFGRLQPYVGIGPGLVILYDEVDAAKNFAIDVMAGLRYMMLKNVSAFVEYKFSHQFDVELESHSFIPQGGTLQRGTATFDYDSHRIVCGVAYHF
jgi:opacity protein-like surface antigen